MRFRFFASIFAIYAVAGLTGRAWGLADYFFQPTGTANYNADANWLDTNTTFQFVPDGSLDERATIDSNGTATVTLAGGNPLSPGALTLGSTAAGGGTLEVSANGTLHVIMGPATSGNISVGAAGSGTVRVLHTGTLTAQGALITGSNATDVVIVGSASAGTATLSAASATLSGTTQVFPNAAFSTTGSVNFGPTSAYTSEVSAAGTGKISAGTTANANGSLKVNFTGVSPTVGSSYPVLEATTIGGGFSAITTNATLPVNQVFIGVKSNIAGGRQQLAASLQEVLVLEVNRNTGVAKITHPGSSAIALDSYYIGSSSSALLPAGFNGLHDQGLLGGNWIETDLRNNNIAELKPSGAATVNAGNQFGLGAIYNPFAGAFGASGEDLEFVYARPSDGMVFNGAVKYTGTAVNNLLLQVNPTTGQTYLRNPSQTSVSIDGYHVQSAAGALSVAGWNSLDTQNFGGADVWLKINDATANLIGEFNGPGFTTLAPGALLSLGTLFNPAGSKDLQFQFLMQGNTAGSVGTVVYEALAAVQGDYNNNGIVDAVDYTVWRDHLGQTFQLQNEVAATTPGIVTIEDYNAWKTRFGMTSGSGSGATGSANAVPEPTTWLLTIFCVAAVCGSRNRQVVENP